MKNKKLIIFGMLFVFVIGAVVFASAKTLSSPSYCCEKTRTGGFCVNTDKEQCLSPANPSATSCDATNYCALGTCKDGQEGLCIENTPKSVCDRSNGVWTSQPAAEMPECQPGCCILGDQVAFVPLVRCKRLSSLYGISINYKADVKTETDCLATIKNQEIGACVFEAEKGFTNTCTRTTRANCAGAEGNLLGNKSFTITQKTFFPGLLCSAEELKTVCARQTSTGCQAGKVYWYDSCGNKENLYSSDKIKSWANGRIIADEKVCTNSNDANCGNCDTLLGTKCGLYSAGTGAKKPAFGNYVCRATSCIVDGKTRKNGEAWCLSETKDASQPVGSRYFKQSCLDGQVILEPCAEYRNEVCVQNDVKTTDGKFSYASCKINRWQDCITQVSQEACTNIQKRDCKWMSLSGGWNACVPKYAPGLKFWEDDAETQCSLGTVTCQYTQERAIGTTWAGGEGTCKENCDCKYNSWADAANEVCRAMGDCGSSINYLGTYSGGGYTWNVGGQTKYLSSDTSAAAKNARIAQGIAGDVKS